MIDFITQPWPWFVGGPLIAFVLFILFYFGKFFGVSSNLDHLCSIAGADKISDYFKIDLKTKSWSLLFVAGIIIGGFIAHFYLSDGNAINLNPTTVNELTQLGFADAGKSYLPSEIFSIDKLLTLKGFVILLGAGVLIGFGTRYAGGCTSGHAITGLSNLELPSLIATIGFFIGGLIMTWFLIPLLF
jgi:uncharacterized membrane protein YedE/YeeE